MRSESAPHAAVFSIAGGALFRPLPLCDADRLFVLRLGDVQPGRVFGMLPGLAVDAARDAGVFDGIGGASSRVWRAYVRESAGLEASSAFGPNSRAAGLHPDPA